MKNTQLAELLTIYQLAIALKSHEGDLVWSRFSGFVVTHTIFFAIISQVILSEHKFIYQEFSLIMISTVGFMLAFLWLISTLRGFESVQYWSYTAIELSRRISDKYKKDDIPNIFQNGRKYFIENREIAFLLQDDKLSYIQRSCITRLTRINTRWTAYLSISLLLGSYMIIFIATLMGKFK